MTKYKKAIDLKNSKENRIQAGRFAAMMQLSTGVDFDRILEGLQYELDLRKFILKFVVQHFLFFMGIHSMHCTHIEYFETYVGCTN